MNKSSIFTASIITLVLSLSSAQAAEPLVLKKLMKELGNNMQLITDGISREDWDQVSNAATHISSHPKPPITERVRIMAFMGTKMSKFKTLDGETHEAAITLERTANEKDGHKVIADFQRLQTTCLNCHQTFRKEFVEHFYGAKNQ